MSTLILLRVALVVLSLVGVIDAFAGPIVLPTGWRLPTQEELSDDWRGGGSDKRAEITGDFNGDGKTDRAVLLMSKKNHALGLFVFFVRSNGTHWHKLDEISDSRAIHAMGIEVVSRGKYKTACGKGYFPCKSGEPEIIQSEFDIINYFKTESANRYIFLDKHSMSFKKVWMSD